MKQAGSDNVSNSVIKLTAKMLFLGKYGARTHFLEKCCQLTDLKTSWCPLITQRSWIWNHLKTLWWLYGEVILPASETTLAEDFKNIPIAGACMLWRSAMAHLSTTLHRSSTSVTKQTKYEYGGCMTSSQHYENLRRPSSAKLLIQTFANGLANDNPFDMTPVNPPCTGCTHCTDCACILSFSGFRPWETFTAERASCVSAMWQLVLRCWAWFFFGMFKFKFNTQQKTCLEIYSLCTFTLWFGQVGAKARSCRVQNVKEFFMPAEGNSFRALPSKINTLSCYCSCFQEEVENCSVVFYLWKFEARICENLRPGLLLFSLVAAVGNISLAHMHIYCRSESSLINPLSIPNKTP